jgi:uncharacterized protein (TIGR03000 family)
MLVLERRSMSSPNLVVKAVVLVAVTLWVGVSAVLAQDGRGYPNQQPPFPWNRYPWDQPKYSGYQEERNEVWYAVPPARRAELARKYHIQVTALPEKNTGEESDRVVLVAHLPDDAQIWFDNTPTQQRGMVRKFVSPPLLPDRSYTYTVRVAWREEGRSVDQVHSLSVHAGELQCIDIIPANSEAVDKRVGDNLAKLAPEDRKVAESQDFCAIQEGIRLGSMGVPVKLTVKGQSVFVCCQACVERAESNPEQTLEQLKKVKAKKPTSSAP